jgi:4-hydroxy-tetrahydrodipicolinate reductase
VLATGPAFVRVAFAVNRGADPDADAVAGVPVHPASDLSSLLSDHEPDALVDFTGPESALDCASACADADVAFVTGTTGFEDGDFSMLQEVGTSIPVLHAANFARGVQALLRTVREAVATLPGYDVELTETHHNAKRDAPSGTARTILAEVAAQREFAEVYGREGVQPREDGEVGVHVRRAGDVRGEHEVMLAGNDEVVTLAHRAESRGVFAAGALDSAVWLAGREAGYYSFGDVIGDSS